jgi:hypothetical protein
MIYRSTMRPNVKNLEKIAQAKMKEVLSHYIIDESLKKEITLGFTIENGIYVWDLYVPQEKSQDAIVISEARVNPNTLEVKVTVFENTYLKARVA